MNEIGGQVKHLKNSGKYFLEKWNHIAHKIE